MNWFRKLFGGGEKKQNSASKKRGIRSQDNSAGNSITDPYNPLYMAGGIASSDNDSNYSSSSDSGASDFGSSASDFGSSDSSYDSGSSDSGSSDSGSSFSD